MEVVVSKYQETAFDIYLSQWPRDWDYEEVMEAVRGEMDAYVLPWFPFENWDGGDLAREIESTIDLFETRFELRKVPA